MSEPNDERSASGQERKLLIGLTVALLAWGLFLAVGSSLGGANLQRSAARGMVVFVCTALFLAFWWVLLLYRKRNRG